MVTLAEAIEKSRTYINDSVVVRFIENNKHISSISTISSLKDIGFGLLIETTNNDVAKMLMINGIKSSGGEKIKVKVIPLKEDPFYNPRRFHEDRKDDNFTEDENRKFQRMHSFGIPGMGTQMPDGFGRMPGGPDPMGRQSNHNNPDVMNDPGFREFLKAQQRDQKSADWLREQSDNLRREQMGEQPGLGGHDFHF